jgi:hypothetical protein
VDRASVNIPYTYVATGALLAEGLQRGDDSAAANKVYAKVVDIARATRLEEVLRAQTQLPSGDTAAQP